MNTTENIRGKIKVAIRQGISVRITYATGSTQTILPTAVTAQADNGSWCVDHATAGGWGFIMGHDIARVELLWITGG